MYSGAAVVEIGEIDVDMAMFQLENTIAFRLGSFYKMTKAKERGENCSISYAGFTLSPFWVSVLWLL